MNIFEEKKIKVRDAVLALDLDGTLTDSKKRISERTKESIDKFIAAGGTVALASGRPTFGVMPVAKILELDKKGGYILSYNGGCFLDCKNNKQLFMKELTHEYLPILEKQAKEFGINLMTYNGDKAYALDIDEQYYMIEININHFIRVKANPLTPKITFPIIKCLMTADGDYLAKVEKEMKKYWEGKLNIVRSEPYFLEVTEVGIDKASTITNMVKKLGKSVDNLICCGDGFNDLSMIRAAGIGVAMANAQERVRAAADYITKSNDEDGIVDVVENLFKWGK
ncbi:Cof-like hydrolase [Lachnoanaerobaculum saburreum F0468]|uniref:Cof-like hydrolase n=1 Tax=Lachnoanaerobaculum saburreum F0468 TaxID=1095750 RepID=I0R900_9FIRM|nr:Cof-type HAD-IIB family hydrolase [Lachnoanaerobaculum saburreum]EIC96158.1 Cof-like hydrolase [Lachnoanaerobaculum saburreum F0468]